MRSRLIGFRFFGVVVLGVMGIFAVGCAHPSPMVRQEAGVVRLLATNADALNTFEEVKGDAEEAMKDTPYPVQTIVSEGTLGSDPRRKRTYESLPDLDKMGALTAAWMGTRDPKYWYKLHDFILAWAKVNVSEGNPINDSKLEPMMYGYVVVRDHFSEEERGVVDTWMRATAHAIIDGQKKHPESLDRNWQSHRIKVVAMVAFPLDDWELKRWVVKAYKHQVDVNLRADGTTLDLERRDALHYQCYDLEPLLTAAITADQYEVDLYDYTSPGGANVAKCVAYLVPYCDGTKRREEFRHSVDPFDQQRAAAGDRSYAAGSMFNPHMGIHTLELATYWEPGLTPVVATLARKRGSAYPTWVTVLNGAWRMGE